MPSLTMAQVLLEEAVAIHGQSSPEAKARVVGLTSEIASRQIEPDTQAEYNEIGKVYGELQKHNSVALCLSGGGIRSATFALGVIEALARCDLLREFHYLSTVSGGGYIGSWLSAWINRSGRGPVFQQLGKPRDPLPDREPDPVHGLREDSNYLTPKLGLLSADTWTGIALYVRNLLMNWAVIGSFILAAVMLPRIAAALLGATGDRSFGWLLVIVAVALLVVTWCIATANRPTWGRRNFGQTQFLRRDLAPFFLAALAWTFALRTGVIDPDRSWAICSYLTRHTNFFIDLALAGAVLAALGWLLGARPWRAAASGEGCILRLADLAATAVAGAIFGIFIAWGSLLYARFSRHHGDLVIVFSLVLGPLWILQAQVFGEAFLVGLRSAAARGTDDREWLARSAGWYGAAGIGWALFCALVLLGPPAVACIGGAWLASSGGVSGLVTTLLGKSSLTKFKPTAKTLPVNVVLAIAAPLFALCLVIGLSWIAALMLYDHATALHIDAAFKSSAWPPIIWAVVLAAAGFITSYFVNINRFSMHSVYRNRLIHAYLGASNPLRRRDPPPATLSQFTGFDQSDNLCMSRLWAPHADGEHRAFLHVVNMALNVVSTRNLAWQERKAEPFTATALHAGSDRVGFRKTAEYAQDLSLGTAMAISGAAASPSMGYHSSPTLAFLLTLFNVRLGWWLGNPGPEGDRKLPLSKPAFQLDGPKLSAWWLAQEMLGLTTDDKAFVYLSDGGHFENLGLYEMVRRRCRYIVMSDAGCDPTFAFEDLGNAVRKIRIDLGIEIYFPLLDQQRASRGAERDHPYWSIGLIEYPEKNERGDPILGHILYLKPALRGDEPADVRSYAGMHDAYPHESTGDQWFSESQFESYRALGDHIMTAAIHAPRGQRLPEPLSIADVIRSLR